MQIMPMPPTAMGLSFKAGWSSSSTLHMDQHKSAAQHSTEPIGGSAHSTDCSIHRRVSSCCMTQSHKPSRSMPRCVRGPWLVATDHTLTPQQLKNRSGSRTKGTVTSNVLWPSPVLSCRPHQPSIECAHATCLGPLHLGCRSALQAQEAATRTAQYDKPLLMCCVEHGHRCPCRPHLA